MATYVVVGASDGIGLEILKLLVEAPAAEVAEIRAVDARAVPQEGIPKGVPQDSRIKVFRGDVGQPHSLRGALEGNCFVFLASACGDHDPRFRGKQHQAEVAAVAAVGRLAAESGTRRLLFVSRQLAAVMASRRTDVLAPLLSEQRIRDSGVEYCIIRLGLLTNVYAGQPKAAGRAPLMCAQRADWELGRAAKVTEPATTRADAAAVCVAAMKVSGCRNTTFDLISGEPLDVEAEDLPVQPGPLFCRLDANFDTELKDLFPEGLVEETIAQEQADFPGMKSTSSSPSLSLSVFKSFSAFVTRPLRRRSRSKSSSVSAAPKAGTMLPAY